YRGAGQHDLTDLSFAELSSTFSDNPYRVPWERAPAADERDRCTIAIRSCRHSVLGERVRCHVFDPRQAIARREGGREHMLREAVAGQKARGSKAGRLKSPGEVGKRRGVYRLGAASGDAPRGQVETDQIGILDAPHGEGVR